MTHHLFSILFLILISALTAFGQPRYRYFDAFEAVNNWVHCVIQDREGYIWVGAEDGLVRYDGHQFRSMTLKEGMNLEVSVLEEDSKGGLWVGTRSDGLLRRGPSGTVTHYLNKPDAELSLPDNRIRSLYAGEDGALWVGTSSGLSVLENGRFQRVEGVDATRVNMLTPWKDGLLAGCRSGLYRVDKTTKKATLLYGDGSVNAMLRAKGGGWWIGTGEGLFRTEKDRWELLPHDQVKGMILSLVKGPEKALWVGSALGLYMVDEKGVEVFTSQAGQIGGLVSSRILDLHRDHNGSVWIATEQGLNHYDPLANRFRQYALSGGNSGGLSAPRTRCVFKDSRDVLWVGTLGGGLNRLDPDASGFEVYRADPTQPGSLNSDLVYCIAEDLEERLWIGTNRGLHRLDKPGEPFKLYMDSGREGSLKNNQIRALFVSEDGTLWVGAKTGGFYRYQSTTDQFIQITGGQDWISRVYAYQIIEDRQGFLWVSALDAGLLRYDRETGEMVNFKYEADNPNSLSDNVSFAFALDERGDFWVGTGNGLNLYAPDTDGFRRFSPEGDVLEVDGLAPDMKGNLWVSCQQGIYRFHKDTETWRLFQVRSQWEGYNHCAFFRSATGEIFFGGNQGYNAFYPREIGESQRAPLPIIHTIKADNEALSPPLKLTWNNRLLSFGFSALHFTDANLVRFAYQLEGVDKEWQMAVDDRNEVSYGKLPGGSYKFRVKARNSDGLWSESGAPVSIKVAVKPWFSWWAWTGYTLLLGLLVRWFTWFYYRRLHLRNLVLERRVQERTRSLENAQTELLEQAHAAGRAEIAVSTLHNVGNVLNSMNISSQQLMELSDSDLTIRFAKANSLFAESLKDSSKITQLHQYFALLIQKMEEQQEFLKENAFRIQEKVEMLRAFIRSQDGLEITQKSEPLELNNLVGQALDMMSEAIKKHGVEVNHPKEFEVEALGRKSKMIQILLEVLHNALEAMVEGGAGRQLKLVVGCEQEQGFIRIQDTGVGFDPEDKEFIFNLGYTTKENRNGFSLHLAANDMIGMRGGIYAESEGVGKGAVFILKLPLHG